MNRKIMIQANSLDKLIDTLLFILAHPDCSTEDVAEYIGFSLRQVDYYTSALRYLGLLDLERKPTSLASDIYANHKAELRERVYACIISDSVISLIFTQCYLLPDSDVLAYAIHLLTQEYPGYSTAVYKRRADNLVKWCRRIIDYHSNYILPTLKTSKI